MLQRVFDNLDGVQRARPPGSVPDPVPEAVLVLDDSHAQRALLQSLLSRWGHEVIVSGDPVEALALARDPRVGLIISDWMMPGMTGPEFCRAVRAHPRDGYAYILLLTSNSDGDALARGLEAGADDFLSKPFRAPELRARLTAGARVVAMQREVVEKNRLLTSALGEIRSLYSALDHDLEEARRLQQSLLQDRFRRFGNVDVSVWLQASGHVGGDMVGFFPVSSKVLGTFSLDVSGHGVASAMIAARVAGILSVASPDQNIALMRREDGSLAALPPDMAAWRLNAMILKELQSDRYFTMCLGFLNRMTGILRLVQAGHPNPVVMRADGRIEQIGTGGLPIGLIPEATYTTTEVRLCPGDRVLMYSDGLTELPGSDGRALDDAGLADLLVRNAARKGPSFLGALARDLTEFAGGENFPDDASALLLEYRDPSAAGGDIPDPSDADAAPSPDG
jgi:sigma-B regulation protein RsbU (phosphoserine phosphatase)